MAICNGNCFGNGIKVSEESDLSDGFLDAIIIHDFTKMGFLKGISQIREGQHEDLEDGVISTIRATSITLACDEPHRKIPLDIDGLSGGRLPAKFEVVPDAAMLF